MTSTLTRLREVAQEQQRAYSGGADRRLGGYLTTIISYGVVVGGLAATARATGRQGPENVSPWGVALIAAATYKMSRLATKAPVTSPLRAPFTEYERVEGAAELAETPRKDGTVQHAIGELLSCPFCMSQWIATSLFAGLVFFPRSARLVASLAGADALQFAHARADQLTDQSGR